MWVVIRCVACKMHVYRLLKTTVEGKAEVGAERWEEERGVGDKATWTGFSCIGLLIV